MPGPYVNQAPVDDDSEMRSEEDRPQGTDPQTMAILSRILSLLQAQTDIPPPQGMMPGADPMGMGGGMPPGPPPMPGMGGPPGMPPGMGGPPGAGGGGLPPELAAMLAGGGAGGGPPMPGPGMPPPGMGGGPPPMPMPGMPPPGMPPMGGGPDMPFTQYANKRMGRM